MAGRIGGYKDLVAWQKGMDLVEAVYRTSALFPADERFGLTSQVRRAATSVPCNVAEGYSRPSRSDYTHFLDIARGSANEVETQLLLAVRLGHVTSGQAKEALGLMLEVQRILAGLVKSLQKSDKRNVRPQASP